MITRDITTELMAAAGEYPVVTVFGPRQSGKTTLARMSFARKPYYSLEDPDVRMAAELDPRGFLEMTGGGAVLDEIQRCPDLLSYIQGIVDREQRPGMFLLTGSHQPDLHQAVAQSLAGRCAVLTLLPFSLGELHNYRREWDPCELSVKGFFPGLHQRRLRHERFFNAYLQTYVERDVRSLVRLRDLGRFQQFLVLLAGRVGQVVNYTSLSNDLGVSATTVKNWLSVLKASYVVFELPPFFENIRKRVVRSPKIYFTDPGLVSFLLGIRTASQAARDPLRGGIYENMVILEFLKARYNHGMRPELYFFRDSHGNEVDLIVREGRKLFPVEIKSSATFTADFLKGIKRFKAMTAVDGGAVLYNGEQEMMVDGVRIFNPLRPEGLGKLGSLALGEGGDGLH